MWQVLDGIPLAVVDAGLQRGEVGERKTNSGKAEGARAFEVGGGGGNSLCFNVFNFVCV